MAFDGITTAALCFELSQRLTGGRIYKIAQTDRDELVLTIKPPMERGGGQCRLYLSADPSLPLAYLTKKTRQAPLQAPAFCMLLRKHLQNGRIVSIAQPGLERILRFEVEHLDEMGDLCRHTLVIELMGKHSNLIFLNDEEQIIDSIKHISSLVSSVREVLPGRPYFVPDTRNKRDPLEETHEEFDTLLRSNQVPPAKLLVNTFTGLSTQMAEELCYRAALSNDRSASSLTQEDRTALWKAFHGLMQDVRNGRFAPTIYYKKELDGRRGAPVGYAAVPMQIYSDCISVCFLDADESPILSARDEKSVRSAQTIEETKNSSRDDSDETSATENNLKTDKRSSQAPMSLLLETFYAQKNEATRIHQKSADLRHIVQTILERDIHKYDLQCKQIRDTEKRDKYRVYGELLNAYGYSIPSGAKSCELDNYYTGEKLRVPLDPTLTPQQNATKYFDRYTKLKRTNEALTQLTAEVREEIEHLRTIQTALNLSTTEGDLAQIRREMEDSGFVKRRGGGKGNGSSRDRKGSGRGSKGRTPASRPLHYVSSDGYDIYVGKNNTQNDALTFHFADGNDIWFHANDMPGSHVILRTGGKPMEDIPDRTFEEAASLAAWYSAGREQEKVEIDYLLRRGVKKPSGARPGFVVYYTNYSIIARTDISGLREV